MKSNLYYIFTTIFLMVSVVLSIFAIFLNFGNIKSKIKYYISSIKFNFKKHDSGWIQSSSPVLGDFDTGTLFDPSIINENGVYKMYISNRKNGSICYTESEDGVNWSTLQEVLISDSENGWEKIINRCSVIHQDDKYKMWYTGQENNFSRIGYAESEDGVNWTKYSSSPVLVPEYYYEGQSVMNPSVIFDEESNLYKMWYASGETYEPDYICYAVSEDGVNWVKSSLNPILTPSNSFYESYKVGGPQIFYLNDLYYLFYIGYSDEDTGRICVAVSNNGITNWTRSSLNPLISSKKNTFNSNSCYKPCVYWNEKNERWMLWYNGRRKSSEYIGCALIQVSI